MTATMPKTEKRPLNKRKILLASTTTLLAALLIVGGLLLLPHSPNSEIVDPNQYRDELVQELTDRQGEYDERSIVLTGTNKTTAKKLAKQLGADLRITSDGSFATLTLPEGVTFLDIAQTEEYLSDLPKMSIDYQARISEVVEEEGTGSGERLPMRPQYTVTDGSYELQTYLDYLNMKNLWDYTRGYGVTVAVIDTGIDTDHPEFAGRISEYSYNATEDKIVKDWTLEDGSYDWSLIEDEQGHGTSVAGVIGASMNSGEIVGIAPEVTLLVIKAECSPDGSFKRTSDLVFGLYYAIERDVSVVNMSFGGYGNNPYAEAAQLAFDSDIICVAAAGNDATANLCYPAADENVFGIGALAADSWELADYSNYGENVDFVAPGTTYTTKMGGGYATTNGTSLACPTATGVIALYMSRNRYQEVAIVEELLRASCYDLGDLGSDWYYGYGAIDAYALIWEDRGTVTFNMMTDELENTEQTFIRNHTLQDMPIPERLYAIFDGWYYDPQCTEEYNWYADEFSSDLTLYANWVNEEDGVPYIYVELDDGTIEIRAYTGHRRYITIPDYIDGKVVSSIGEGAFAHETNLREINLPKYLVRIRDRAFLGCANLIKMSISDTVIEIGKQAFYDNVRLSSVAFGENSQLTTIGDFAFSGCGKLRSFTVPKNVSYLNGSAFYGDTSMMSFAVQEGSEAFFAQDGVLFNATMTNVVCYPAGKNGEYTIPETVTTIDVYAFAFAKISQIELSNVRTIGSAAFIYSRLQALTIPDSVMRLDSSAFAGCTYLQTLTIGHGLTEISAQAFCKCTALQSVEIPNTIQSIGAEAFCLASLYQGVTFEENSSLLQIGAGAFSMTAIPNVEIPTSVTVIGYEAFYKCFSLLEATFAEGSNLALIGGEAFAFAPIAQIVLPEKLEEIGGYAFENTMLQSITLPASLTTLGEGVFASCHSLENIFVDDANTVYIDIDGVVYDINKSTLVEYPAGNGRTEYTVLDGVTVIGPAAFYGAWNVQYVYLPDTLQGIQREAFRSCLHLYTIAIPDSVMQISNHAFAEDWNLWQVSFTENSQLPRISYEAFAYCGLTSFRVPANVSTMAQGAFKGCSNLTSFTFAANSKLESISAYMFDGCANLQRITFEQGSVLTSIQAHGLEGMTKLQSIDFGDAKLTNIDNFAFRFCESLTRVDIPEGVTNLGRFAFYRCTSLSEVQIPSTMEHIGRFAFLGTNELSVYFASESLPLYLDEDWDHGTTGYYLGVSDVITEGDWKYATLTNGGMAILKYLGEATELDLTTLDLGGDIVNIGGKAFFFSTVESIKLPETLTTIQPEAFYHANLKSLTIPESVQFIGRSAFAYTPITSLTFAGSSKLTVMEQSAFENTEALGSVVLPKSLTTIGRAIFKNSSITTLTFEDGIGITEISEEAFAYTDIQTLTIPDHITLINHNAFRNTAHLESVSFGSADFMVMSNAFYQSGLKSLNIPANMTYVGEYAFVALPNLTEFTVDANNPYYTAVDGLLVGQNGRKLIAVPAGRQGSLTVPEGIEVIGFGAFEDTKLSEITFLPDANILSLGYRAFYNAKNIKTMHIPASVVAIDYYAFANCSALETVTFAESNGLNGVYEGAFYGCKNLTNILLPDGIDEISDFAFYGCRKLTRLPVSDDSAIKGIYSYAMAYSGLTGEFTTPATLYDIGDYAFMGTKVTKVTIPDTNAWDLVIGIGAFEECNALEEITVPFIGASFENPEINWFGYIFGAGGYEANSIYVPASLRKVSVTADISVIGRGAFFYLSTLESIDIPKTVNTVYFFAFAGTEAVYEISGELYLLNYSENPEGEYSTNYLGQGISGHLQIPGDVAGYISFVNFQNLVSVNIPKNIWYFDFNGCSSLTSVEISEGVTNINDGAFRGCSSLTSIEIPDSVTSIGESAFSGCSSLTSIEIPDSVTSIGEYAFSFCSSLINVDILSGVTSIGESAFNECSSLTSIEIPESVTDIGSRAFFYCSSLTSIKIPSSVKFIGDRAFAGCKSLANIEISATITKIEDATFSGCSSLASIKIPEGVTNIGVYAFNECSSLISIDTPESITSISERAFYGCSSLIGMDLPEGITSIGEWAFYGCSGLTSIEIPKDITRIEEYTFYGCSSLTNIDIPKSVTSIGECAFCACSSLTSVEIPEGVTSIEVAAFADCSSLTSIEIPDGVIYIGAGAFRDCSSLYVVYNHSDIDLKPGSWDNGGIAAYAKMIIDKNGNKIYRDESSGFECIDTADGFCFIKENGEYKLIAYLGDEKEITLPRDINGNQYSIYQFIGASKVIIPEGITSINAMAFYGSSTLTSIELPESITSIGQYAFSGCRSLSSIEIPTGVTSIGIGAFMYCSTLESVVIPEGVTSIGWNTFGGCSSLTSINIPQSIVSIDVTAFLDCANLKLILSPENQQFTLIENVLYNKEITQILYLSPAVTELCIPKSVTSFSFEGNTNIQRVRFEEGSEMTSIGYGMFAGCSNLVSIEIPASVTSIGSNAFSGCSSLTSITIPDSVMSIGWNAFDGCSSLTSIEIPNGVTSIGGRAFYECSSLTSIEIPNGVTIIEDSTFFGCRSLMSIEIPNGVTSIGGWAFYECSSLTSIEISADVASIGMYAFCNCSKLQSIEIPASVTNIGEYAFGECSSLTSIEIPNGVTSIEANTFSWCRSLTSIEIPNGVTSIGEWAFSGCSSLTSIEIPDGVTSIGENTFSGCSSLTSIEIPEGITNIGRSAFSGCSSLTSIEIPEGITNIEDGTFSDCSSLTSIQIPDEVTSIGEGAFGGCSSLTIIEIPEGVTSIGERAFSSCSSLTSIEIPEGVTNFGERVFSGCSSLTSIEIPESVTSIGEYEFSGCSSLTSIEIPEGVTSIGEGAFSGCSSLTSIEIPEGITSIEEFTFYWCSGLASIEIPTGVTHIAEYAFAFCENLARIKIPQGVTSISSRAFYVCTSLMSIEIPSSITTIGDDAFFACENLYVIYNNSDIELTIGSESNGNLAHYAKQIVDKNGNIAYKDELSGFACVDTADGFRYIKENGEYTLVEYFGEQETVVLPTDINGNTYKIKQFRGGVNVIIPDGVTVIDYRAFADCSTLASITIPDSVTSIEYGAFSGCINLISITIPDSVTSIGESAFFGCSNLISITIPDSVTSIGSGAFYNTAYYKAHYNNLANWNNGALYIDNNLFYVPKDAQYYACIDNVNIISQDAFLECYLLKRLSVRGNQEFALAPLTNLETLVITKLPSHYIYEYFGWWPSDIPFTLKNIVLADDVAMTQDAFEYITGITIYVAGTKEDTMWDENFPGWNNGNKVVYGDEWITADFYNVDGSLAHSEIFRTSQVIRVPYMDIPSDDQYEYTLIGWDIDGDGIADTIPATSTVDIVARPVVEKTERKYTVNFYDKDGVTILYSYALPYGSTLPVPENPTKQGYTFLGWIEYDATATVNGDMDVYSEWKHAGEGHIYGDAVWVDPTCTEQGYNKHTCTICGEWYGTDFAPAKGHNHTMTTVDPTCTTKGYDMYECSCGDTYKQNYTNANGHSYGDWIVDAPATCTQKGAQHRVCLACDHTEEVTLNKTSHKYHAETIKQATCTEQGEICYTCEVCEKTVTELTTLAEHSYQKTYVDKAWLLQLAENVSNMFYNCEGEEAFYYECTDCGRIRTYDETTTNSGTAGVQSASCNHVLTDWQTYIAANCREYGIDARICIVCQKPVEIRLGDKPGEHSYSGWIVTQSPTCTEIGQEIGKCSGCGHEETREIAALGHDKVQHAAQSATCTEIGWSAYETCSRCDYTTYVEIPATGHNHTSVVTPPTCTEQGYTTHTCHCGDSYVDTYVDALGHSLGEWTQTKAPTCTEKGEECRDCERCDHFETREIDANGHNYNSVEGEEYIEHTCTVCGHHYSEEIIRDPVALTNTLYTTAWGMDFATSITAKAPIAKGAKFHLYYNAEVAAFGGVTGSDKVTIDSSVAGELTVKVLEYIAAEEVLMTLSFTTSELLNSGSYTLLTVDENSVETCEFTDLVIYEMGDVNLDGKINSRDVTMIKQYVVKMVELTDVQKIYANVYVDTDKDGNPLISSRDAVLIQQYVVKMDVQLGNRGNSTSDNPIAENPTSEPMTEQAESSQVTNLAPATQAAQAVIVQNSTVTTEQVVMMETTLLEQVEVEETEVEETAIEIVILPVTVVVEQTEEIATADVQKTEPLAKPSSRNVEHTDADVDAHEFSASPVQTTVGHHDVESGECLSDFALPMENKKYYLKKEESAFV